MAAPYLNAPISAVCVFAPGVSCARITRSADLASLPDKPAQIRIGGLPLALDDDSLRLRVEGNAAVATDVTILYEVPPADPALLPAEDAELLAAEEAVQAARQRRERCAQRQKDLAMLQIAKRPQQRRDAAALPPPVAARLEIAALRRDEAIRLAREQQRLTEELRLAEERYSDLSAKAQKRSSARQARKQELRKTALISLRWEARPAGCLHLEYQVPGALWAPRYAVRFDPAMSKAHLEMSASVCQKTGEDWSGVRLTLSTADPLAWHDLPVLDSIRLGRRQAPAMQPGWRPPPAVAEELFAGFDLVCRKPEIDEERPVMLAAGGAAAPVALPAPAPSPASARAPASRARLMKAAAPAPAAMPQRTLDKSVDATIDRLRDSIDRTMDRSIAVPAGAVAGEVDLDADVSLGAMEDLSATRGGELLGAIFSSDTPGVPSRDMMNFGNLVLPPAEDPDRGRLRPATDADRTAWMFAMQSVRISVEVKQIVAMAISEAYRLKGAEPPDDCVLPVTPRFAHSYTADLPASIPSDGAWHTTTLTSAEARTELRHVVVPREAREVFRQAVLDNPLDAPLLTGPADLYVGDAFLLTAPMHQTAPGGQVRLGLGVEQGITVARNTNFDENAAGMLKGALSLEHQVRCTVVNKLQRPVIVEVRERIPIPAEGEENCKVKLTEVSPPWQAWQPEDGRPLKGGHAWMLHLEPSAREELKLAYTIAIPARNEIAGGNRRES